jgi:hypothetical protein
VEDTSPHGTSLPRAKPPGLMQKRCGRFEMRPCWPHATVEMLDGITTVIGKSLLTAAP